MRAAETIKLGYVSPQTGPLAAFAEADDFVIKASWQTVKDGIEIGGATYQRRGGRQGQPVQSQPRRRGRQGADRRRRDRPDARRLDAGDHQPGLHPMRDRGDAVHLDGGAVAALFHRPAGEPWRPDLVEAVQLHLPLLLGARGRHRRLHQHVGPARDQQIGRRPLPE